MQKISSLLTILLMSGIATLLLCTSGSNGQVFDQLFSGGNNPNNPNLSTRFGSVLRDLMSVSVPGVYDMTKNGNSMGINVLSGLVKVERGGEAERSGLIGPKPLSVRVFGIPVYERGQRVRPIGGEGNEPLPGPIGNGIEPSAERPGPEDEELPITT